MLRARIRYHTENANEWPKLSGVDEEEYATKVKTGNFLEVGVFFLGDKYGSILCSFLDFGVKKRKWKRDMKALRAGTCLFTKLAINGGAKNLG